MTSLPQLDIRLSSLIRVLEEAGYDCNQLNYRKLWQAAVEGRFPAGQINGVWHFSKQNTPTIAGALHLQLRNEAPDSG